MESGTSTFLGMDTKGKRLNGQARRLTYPSLQVLQQNLHSSCRKIRLNFVLRCPRESRIASALKKAVTVPILFFRVTSLLVTHVSACLRPVQQVESRNKTSDIHRPFCLFLCASSPWIKFKETHRLFQKFRFAKEVLFFLSDTYYGRKITLYRSYDMYFKYFLPVIESEELSFLHVFHKNNFGKFTSYHIPATW